MFSSKEEFAKAMIDGRVFRCRFMKYYAIWNYEDEDEDTVLRFVAENKCGDTREMTGVMWNGYTEVTEVLPWYERIPEKGVLCWVGSRIVQIMDYDPTQFFPLTDHIGGHWHINSLHPLTLDEAKQLIVEQ